MIAFFQFDIYIVHMTNRRSLYFINSILFLSLLIFTTCARHGSSHRYSYDILIKQARIADGTGNPWYYSDVAIKDGMIVKVEPAIQGKARQVIDAGNRMLTPGFIDVHAHADNL